MSLSPQRALERPDFVMTVKLFSNSTHIHNEIFSRHTILTSVRCVKNSVLIDGQRHCHQLEIGGPSGANYLRSYY